MSDEFATDPRAGDICVQLANILDDTDKDKLKLAVNDEDGHIQKEWTMPRTMFNSQFHELTQQKGTYIKRVQIVEIDNGMVKIVRLDAMGNKTATHQSVNIKIFRKTYILESLANLPPETEQESQDEEEDDEIVELEQEV
jgi:5-hydroxyisourate hydrolase-like protein (transthyretin family)